MWIVVAVHERDNLPHYFGPFAYHPQAESWASFQKDGDDHGWRYKVEYVQHPKDFEQ